MRTQDAEQPRPRAPRGSLSEARIAAAALTILSRDGMDGLTMRGVAAELGTGPMSLYRHVKNHEALVELVRARVMATEVASLLPPAARRAEGMEGRAGRDALRRLLHEVRARLRRHPGAVVLFHSETFRQPPVLHSVEQLLACLVEAGVGPERLASTSAALWTFVVGSVLAEQSTAAAWPGEEVSPTRRKAWAVTMRNEVGRVAPRVASEAAAWSALSHDEVFAEGLELLLAGLERARP